jgi:Tfp pilus assembly protein PilX
MRYRSSTFARRGVSLVITLLCITVLTVIVMAFMQSMSLERKTAASYSNIARAQLAAESAQNEAVSRLSTLMSTLPYHAIGYTNATVNGVTQLYTILFGAANANATPTPYYLLSSTNTNAALSALGNLPGALDITNTTAMNRRTSDGSTNDPGWMGSPVSTNGTIQYREARAPWVYILQDPTKPHQPNRANANYNPRVARYAWWIEDETSKLDVTVAGNNEGPSGGFRSAVFTNVAGTNTAFADGQITQPSQLDLGAAPLQNGLPITTNNAAVNNQLITFRTNAANIPRDGHFLAQVPSFASSEAKARYYTTLASVANDLAGNGMRRANINAIVTDADTDPKKIAADLDDIAYVISGTHLFKASHSLTTTNDSAFFLNNTNSAMLPDFGSRIYPVNPTSDHRNTYLIKLAANIRDYITSTENPTFVDSAGMVFAGTTPPGFSTSSAFPQNLRYGNGLMPRAIGQKPLPYFHKHAYAFSILGWNSTTRSLTFTIDQHFSFFNPTTKDFVAPPGSFVRVLNRFRWNGQGVGTVAADDIEIDISNRTFRAGRTTVVTTSPSSTLDLVYLGSESDIIRATAIKNLTRENTSLEGARKFTNLPLSGGLPLNAVPRDSGANADYHTVMVLGNSKGYFGGHASVITTQALRASIVNNSGNAAFSNDGTSSTYLTSSSICGNDAPSRSGDPRSLNQNLAFNSTYSSGVGASANQKDQDRFYHGSTPLYQAQNGFINPTGNGSGQTPWPDFVNSTVIQDDLNWAYGVVRCEPMTSIGELGNIYDPHRKPPIPTDPALHARGGGRTLRIGQPDDVIGGATATRFSSTWQNAAWRLTDIFDVVLEPDPSNSSKQIANRTDAEAPSVSKGKININSVIRDNGMALRAFLRRFSNGTRPHTDYYLSGRAWTETEISEVIKQTRDYITSKGPFVERGELSQLAFFNSGNQGTYRMSDTMDRGREELVRRILPMVTTRSSTFSIYAIAQSVREDNTGKLFVLAESSKGTVFQFDPKYPDTPTQPYRKVVSSFLATPLYDKF